MRKLTIVLGALVAIFVTFATGTLLRAQGDLVDTEANKLTCTVPAEWGGLQGGVAVTTNTVNLTFQDKNGTIRIVNIIGKNCRVLAVVTRQ